ncbi:MAG: hypothetical protein Q8Q50_04790 [Methylobacter sp.]|nr:hypothetical protein [Methylobacter sp.]
MSLITCKECNVKISSKADKCPHCGAPVKKKTSLWVWLIAAVVLITVFGGKPSTKTAPAPASVAPAAVVEQVNVEVKPPVVVKAEVNANGEREIKADGFIGCISETTFHKVGTIRSQGDGAALTAMLMPELASGRCVIFKQGNKVFLSDTKVFSGMIQVRPVGVTLSYWTNIEAL